jgi:hypothetical protein
MDPDPDPGGQKTYGSDRSGSATLWLDTKEQAFEDQFAYHEHGGAQDVAGIVAPELDPVHLLLLVEVDRLDLVHGRLQVSV